MALYNYTIFIYKIYRDKSKKKRMGRKGEQNFTKHLHMRVKIPENPALLGNKFKGYNLKTSSIKRTLGTTFLQL